MRKFWIVLLLLGLIVAFTMPVCAADVKFSGSYVVQGYYEDNRKLSDPEGSSLSNMWQRLRVQTVFQVQEGLKLTTRFDAMEKIWGATRSSTVTGANTGSVSAENENIKFDDVFVTFAIPIGTIEAGYMNYGAWGTVYGNSTETTNAPRVRYTYEQGPIILQLAYDKNEGSKGYSSTGPAGTPANTDDDFEKYNLYFTYKWNTGSAGVQIQYNLDSSNSDAAATYTASNGYRAKYWAFYPYVKATFGRVYLEAELGFAFGDYKEYISANNREDQDMESWRGYIMASVDLAPAYVGALAFYASGDDPGTTDKYEGGLKTGPDFNPCLILMNYDLGRWNGVMGGANGVSTTYNMDNVFGAQLFAGIKPIPRLDIKASVTYAKLNENPSATTRLHDKDLGYEADITATYMIFDNLSYMVGFGYLFAGDAYEGASHTSKVEDDFLLTHKLTLTF